MNLLTRGNSAAECQPHKLKVASSNLARATIFALLLLLALPCFANYPVTGKAYDGAGNPIDGTQTNIYVQFDLMGCNGNPPRVVGSSTVVGQHVKFPVDVTGNVVALDGVSTATIYGNNEIECPSGYKPTQWQVTWYINDAPIGPRQPYTIIADFDLNSAVPNTTNPVVPAPTGDTTYARLDTGNMPFTGSVAGKRIGSTRYADQFSGATISAKITAAMADCPVYGTSDSGCLVVIPSTMACGEPNQASDNVLLVDYRGCAQGQGLRFNLSATAADGIRSKMYLQDNFGLLPNPTTSGSQGSATLYVQAIADRPEQGNNTYSAINGTMSVNSMNDDKTTPLIGIEAEAIINPSIGGAHSVSDVRGSEANTVIGGQITADVVMSSHASAPVKQGSGIIHHAYSFVADMPSDGTVDNIAGWFKGLVQVDGILNAVGGLKASANIFPATVGCCGLGNPGLPFTQYLLGSHAVNYAVISGTFGQATTLTVPDPGAAVATFAYRNTAQSFTGVQNFISGYQVATGATITKHLSGTASLNFTAWAGADCQDLTVTVTGAVDGDNVTIGVPLALSSTAGVQFTGFVSASDTVTVRGCKITAGASADPAAATVRASATHY